MARRLNTLFHRKGPLWGDRYHRHDLTTPRQVRNALAYVYANFKKHGHAPPGLGALDPFSSALTFNGWNIGPIVRLTGPPLRHHRPRTWLLRTGWLRAGGPIDVWLPIVVPKRGYGVTQGGYNSGHSVFRIREEERQARGNRTISSSNVEHVVEGDAIGDARVPRCQ